MTLTANAPGVTGITAIHPNSLGDLAYRELRSGILSGAIEAGTELNEVRLSEQLGVSRTPLRDAIKRLEDVGLVETRPRRQARVRSFTSRDFVDIYNTRLALEGAAVRLCAVGRLPLTESRRLLDELAQLGETDTTTIANLEHAFHASLVDAAGNSALIRAYTAIGAQLQTALAANHGTSHPSPRVIADSHRSIVDAIEAGDERLALDTIETHILEAVEVALITLDGDMQGLMRPTRELP